MSTSDADFSALNTLANVATGGQAVIDRPVPHRSPATVFGLPEASQTHQSADPLRTALMPQSHERASPSEDAPLISFATDTSPSGESSRVDRAQVAFPGGNSPGTQPQPSVALYGADPRLHSVAPASSREDSVPREPLSPAAPSGAGAPAAQHALFQDAARMIESLTGAMQSMLQSPRTSRPPVKVPVPKYRGYGDRISATDFLEALLHYQQATGRDDQEILGRILPIALTDQAARWFRLVGQNALTLDEFRAAFRLEFLPADYERRMRRELERRTQHPDESLLEYVRVMQELFALAEPSAPDAEKVERVVRQSHPTFAAYLRGSRFRNLDELALEARRIQGDILAARAYRPPPPPSASLEPRCAWNGGSSSRPRQNDAATASADERVAAPRDISLRALDPYTYSHREADASTRGDRRNRDHNWNPGRNAQNSHDEPRSAQNKKPASRGNAHQNSQSRISVRCFRCNRVGHFSRECTDQRAPPRQALSGNGPSRR